MAGRESSRAISRGRDGRENAAGMEERMQQGWKGRSREEGLTISQFIMAST